MDKMLRIEVVNELRAVMTDVLEASKEQWVTADQLSAQVSCFSKTWLKEFGKSLPRTRAIVTDENGIQHMSSWAYPLHRIQRMLLNNEVKQLKINKHEDK